MKSTIHTKEQLVELSNITKKALDTKDLARKHNCLELQSLCDKFENQLQNELDKYDLYHMPVKCNNYTNGALGKIEKISHFAVADVILKVKYNTGGFDSIRLSEVEEISEEVPTQPFAMQA